MSGGGLPGWAWLIAACVIPVFSWMLIEFESAQRLGTRRPWSQLAEFAIALAALAALAALHLALMIAILPSVFGFGILR